MSRSLVTAIMLEELRRANAEIRLVKGSLVTPAARDWFKEHELPVIWEEPTAAKATLAVVMDPGLAEMRAVRTMLDRRGGLAEVIDPGVSDKGIVPAVRQLSGMVAGGKVGRGVVFVQDAAVSVCVANKHNGIRAAVGMDIPTVEQACRDLGINVLVIEYPAQTAYQMNQMIDRFMRGAPTARPDIAAGIQAIEQGV